MDLPRKMGYYFCSNHRTINIKRSLLKLIKLIKTICILQALTWRVKSSFNPLFQILAKKILWVTINITSMLHFSFLKWLYKDQT